MKAVIDTNVYLDAILNREPFVQDSRRVIAASELEFFDGYCCATTLTDIYYIVQKAADEMVARQSITDIVRTCSIASVSRTTISAALISKINDFEDGVLCEAAIQVNATCIITRNVPDFAQSPIMAITPTDFLALLNKGK